MAVISKASGQRRGLAILLTLGIGIGFIYASHSPIHAPASSPEASTALICPNDELSDCYPSTFQPMEHFQPIRPGQAIPPGLHIRINIATGEKEAKLNIPEEQDGGHNGELVIKDDVEIISPELGGDRHDVQAPIKHHPGRPSTGPKKATKPLTGVHFKAGQEKSEAFTFDTAAQTVKELLGPQEPSPDAGGAIIDSLGSLTELAHDLEWGIALTRDWDLLSLLEYTLETYNNIADDLRSSIFLLLGTAIQNNVAANKELRSFEISHDKDLILDVIRLLHRLEARTQGTDDEHSLTLKTRAVFFLSQICADDDRLAHFALDNVGYTSDQNAVRGTGLSQFLGQLAVSSAYLNREENRDVKGHLKLQIRIANFITDYAGSIARLAQTPSQHSSKNTNPLMSWCAVLLRARSARQTAKGDSYNNDDGYQSFSAAREAIVRAMEDTGHVADLECF